MRLIRFMSLLLAATLALTALLSSWSGQGLPIASSAPALDPLAQEAFIADRDAYVASGPNWANSPRGASPGLYVGYGDEGVFNLQRTRAFVHFDVSRLRGMQISGAALELYLVFFQAGSLGQVMDIEVHPVLQNWGEYDITWNRQPGYGSAVVVTGVGTTVNQVVRWNIPPQLIQQWVDEPARNGGLTLVSPSGEASGAFVRSFAAREYQNGVFAPRLVVDYGPPPATATPTLTPTQTATLTPTPTPTPVPLKLALTGVPDTAVQPGDEITYTIVYSNRGAAPLTHVWVRGRVPDNTVYVPNSATDGAGGLPFWEHEVLGAGTEAAVSYRVRVVTLTPAPTPTASLTPSTTPSAMPTPTVAVTATPTESGTPVPPPGTATMTATPTATATVTPTPTDFVQPALTPTPTETERASAASPLGQPRSGAAQAVLATATPTFPIIVNWAEGFSDQTGRVTSPYVIHGGARLYLPLLTQRGARSQPAARD